MNIREEIVDDVAMIEEITIAAFKDHKFSNQKEQLIVNQLRSADALAVSLVAEDHHRLVGHIAFSKVMINGKFNDWYGLAPVSVKPSFQNVGIGSQLIIEGLEKIKLMGAKACVLLGEPEYYQRFAFTDNHDLVLEGVPKEYFLVLAFSKETTTGIVKYHQAFSDNE